MVKIDENEVIKIKQMYMTLYRLGLSSEEKKQQLNQVRKLIINRIANKTRTDVRRLLKELFRRWEVEVKKSQKTGRR